MPSDWLQDVDVSFPTIICSHDKLAICIVFSGLLAPSPQIVMYSYYPGTPIPWQHYHKFSYGGSAADFQYLHVTSSF